MKKTCAICGRLKDESWFYAGTAKCKPCYIENRRVYSKTVPGLIAQIHSSQVASSKQRKHNQPAYNKEELENWMRNQTNFNEIYADWQNSGYTKDLRPSVDRLDDDEPYYFGNIQLLTWYQHKYKARKGMKADGEFY